MSWSAGYYSSLCRCYNRIWHNNMNRRLLFSSCQVLNGCVKVFSQWHALAIITYYANPWQCNDATANLVADTCALVFSHKEAVSCSSPEESEAVIVEMAQMPPIGYISGKLIYCFRARRISSDNTDIVSLCQAGARMMPAWYQVWKKELKMKAVSGSLPGRGVCLRQSYLGKRQGALTFFIFNFLNGFIFQPKQESS